jgi:hypothetical protein
VSLPGRSYDLDPCSLWGVLRREQSGPFRGGLTPFLLVNRWPERGSQLVGSLATKASLSPLKVVSKAPGVVGKSADSVSPTT